MIRIKLHATTCSVNLHNSKTIDLNLDHAYSLAKLNVKLIMSFRRLWYIIIAWIHLISAYAGIIVLIIRKQEQNKGGSN